MGDRVLFIRPSSSGTPLLGSVTFDGHARDYYQLDPSNVSGSNPTGYWGNIGGSLCSHCNPSIQLAGPYVRPWIGTNTSTAYPNGDFFTADASRSGAAGDRGFRTVLATGTNQGGGGIKINFDASEGVTPYPEIWVKLWVRFPTGLQPGGTDGSILDRWHYIKEFDFNDENGTDKARVTWGAGQGGGSGNFGALTYESQTAYGPNLGTLTWSSMMGGSGSVVPGDGVWHSYQMHMKKATNAGLDNGEMDFWFDDVHYMSYQNVDSYHTTAAFTGWRFFAIAVNQNWVHSSTTDWFWDVDDIMWTDQGFITQDSPS